MFGNCRSITNFEKIDTIGKACIQGKERMVWSMGLLIGRPNKRCFFCILILGCHQESENSR